MIIECVNCSKKFEVNSSLIPVEGRTIQCGSCNHVWFFKKKDTNLLKSIEADLPKKDEINKTITKKTKNKTKENKSTEIVEYKPKSGFTIGKFLGYILVIIISFIALIIFLDTFKNPLYNFFPDLELILFSLFETLKDINLFIKDLF